MTTPPRSVLVVIPRRIGDVLLATPLMRSIKRGWPGIAIDALVFEGTEGVLEANPDLRRIIPVAEKPGFGPHLAFLLRLWRRYDMALSLVPGDRPTLYAFAAGRWRAGLLVDRRKESWKKRLLDRWLPFDNLNTHTVRMHLALAAALGIDPVAEVVTGWRDDDRRQVERLLGTAAEPLAVLHAYPKFNYKMWHRDGWIEVARWLAARGYRVALSGGNDAAELAYLADLARGMPATTIVAAGKLSLGAAACLVSRAALYVGTDTALTHVAAAQGVPTVALFGPSNPVKWGPWPRDHAADADPWKRCGTQRRGNVLLLQGVGGCVPCLLEGCDRNIASFSDCLQQLSAGRVIAAIAAVTGDG
ncbi:MAG: glycosyltransferase family 9 protein [Burkholderiales bacterium]